ncbi:MAG: cupin domain-containing protein [Sphingomonas sp.]|uniref:cupin domain-containing protein n=1 Tax=Sphingomonas sp. TaxID=28214 RepID=UPI001841BF17|nr:cupin domain-containing protein [Sphingomonas sp.]MBA3667005.1 cupin domain-containing protein [Sphingomonas sp.]
MPKVDLSTVKETNRTGYPTPFDRDVDGRWYRRIALASGIEDFGASLVRLEPGAWSSQRHWHEGEDELLLMIEGEAVLAEDHGRTLLRPGDIVAWPKDVPNGHHLINESAAPCRFLVVGGRSGQDCHYPDIDLLADGRSGQYLHKDRTPY